MEEVWGRGKAGEGDLGGRSGGDPQKGVGLAWVTEAPIPAQPVFHGQLRFVPTFSGAVESSGLKFPSLPFLTNF